MNEKFNLKRVLGLCIIGGALSLGAVATASDCPTCCNTSPDAYACYLPPFDDHHQPCDFGGSGHSATCSNYSGLSFNELEDGRGVEMDWSGIVQSGGPPRNAFVFGYDDNNSIVCQQTMSGMQVGVPQSSTLICPASAVRWVYDAN